MPIVGSMKSRRGRPKKSTQGNVLGGVPSYPVTETHTAAERSVNRGEKDLPVRLFATDRYPVGRLNIYSKVDILSTVHEKLKDTPEFTKLKSSSLGNLFDLPLSRCSISCKLIHSLLVRQLVTNKKYEWWTVFGGQPLRFSLSEFGYVTGLNCSEFPEEYSSEIPQDNLFWKELIGEDTNATLGDVAALFEESNDMPSWRKLGLALILIVDGVLIAKHQIGRPTPRYVEMVKDLDSFLGFPWGRESFLATISGIRPRRNVLPDKRGGGDRVEIFGKQLGQQTFSIRGFPLALQLLAFKSVFGLVERIPNGRDPRTFVDGFPMLSKLNINDIRDVEHDINLVVVPVIEEHGEEGWDDEVKDKKVAYMEKLIKSEHVFEKGDWPGGDDSLDMYMHKPKTVKGVVLPHRNHVVGKRKVNGEKTKKQGKVSECSDTERSESEVDKDGLVAEIAQLKDAVKQLSDRVVLLERERDGNERTKTKTTLDVVMQEVGNDSLYNDIGPIAQAIRTMYETELSIGGGSLDATGEDALCLSDSSPPMKRPKYNASEEEKKLSTVLVSKERREPHDLLPAADDAVFKLFKETLELDKERQHVTPCNFLIDNKFLLDLAKPKHFVTTLHMEVLVSFSGARHEKVLAEKRSCFVAPWFINHLQGKYQNFRASTNKRGFVWGEDVKQFVCKPGKVWFKDVDTVYVPMIWADEHWVGVVINLKLWSCQVLDPLTSLNADRKMKRYMAPVVEQLPYIVQQFCNLQSHGLKPFICNRWVDTYENERCGDCGPVAMKFMELHAEFGEGGGSVAYIDDGIVDDLRKQYAMDLYAELIAPQILS